MKPLSPLSTPHYEGSDASPRLAAVLAGSLGLCILLGIAATEVLYRHQGWPGAAGALATRFQDAPSVHTSIDADWAKEKEEVRNHLDGYGWVDRSAGIVRIPIERAMKQMLIESPQSRTNPAGQSP